MHPMSNNVAAIFWAVITVGVYLAARVAYARLPRWWTSPMLVTWLFCGALLLGLQSDYKVYLGGTHWLVTLLGPATVAFAIPIHAQRMLIRKHWILIAVGVIVGSVIAFTSSWILAWVFQLSPEMRASLLPRSVSIPFAMAESQRIGGLPELTATFTAITALFGAAIGDGLLSCLPFRTAFARGAFFGMGAHGAGVAKAREYGQEEGAIAGLIMIFAGLFNVLAATAWMSL